MSFTMHSDCLTVTPGCLTNSPVPLTMSPGLFTAGSGCLTANQLSLTTTLGVFTAGSGSLTVNSGRLTANPGSFTTSSGWVFFEIKGMVLSVLYWFIGYVCHFLCLETKKVTKENSRQKQKLRCFCLANAPVASGEAEFCLGMADEWGY
jgi:hypothetical protein